MSLFYFYHDETSKKTQVYVNPENYSELLWNILGLFEVTGTPPHFDKQPFSQQLL